MWLSDWVSRARVYKENERGIVVKVAPPDGSSQIDGIKASFVSEVTPLLWIVRGWCVMLVVSRARF